MQFFQFTNRNGKFIVDHTNIYTLRWMSSGEVFEGHIINNYLKPYIEKSTYIVDIGANIGCHGISYANFNKEAIITCIEPQKLLCDILKENIKINNISPDRMSVLNNAVGHENKNITLCTPPYDSTCGGYTSAGVMIGIGGEETTMITIDSLNLPGLDFMKIDVEGAEGLVIMGARETIKKYKPVIFFEHNSITDANLAGIGRVPTPFEELVKLGYKTFKYVDWDNYITIYEENDGFQRIKS